MYLRVYFGDNDFCIPVYTATEELMYEIANGYSGKDFPKAFLSFIEKFDLDEIRKRLVLSTIGAYIMRKGTLGRFDSNKKSSKYNDSLRVFDDVLTYIDESIKVSIVDNINSNDDNLESCYIEVHSMMKIEPLKRLYFSYSTTVKQYSVLFILST